ncbi:MAG: NADH-quinone oxidoreductase subunit C [Sphingobacteriales bacterium]|nr:MAG: NADH-quinone oxidoreductase subunit C [Sphingobacteriales bacterium]TAF82323.1 MAG: NADH-quinone oxidoreductase subunit C [Sphingobacteriales bacterium]
MGKITNLQVIKQLTSHFEGKFFNVTEPYGLLTIETTSDNITQILSYLKNDTTLAFVYLTDITGIHYPDNENALGVIYHLHSLVNNVRLRIKVFVPTLNPSLPSATTLWNGANWMERETFDFFGIVFDGHPNLVRILNVDDMEAHPMRKEYPLEDPNRVDKQDLYFGR